MMNERCPPPRPRFLVWVLEDANGAKWTVLGENTHLTIYIYTDLHRLVLLLQYIIDFAQTRHYNT